VVDLFDSRKVMLFLLIMFFVSIYLSIIFSNFFFFFPGPNLKIVKTVGEAEEIIKNRKEKLIKKFINGYVHSSTCLLLRNSLPGISFECLGFRSFESFFHLDVEQQHMEYITLIYRLIVFFLFLFFFSFLSSLSSFHFFYSVDLERRSKNENKSFFFKKK